jgi:hypothetical protein
VNAEPTREEIQTVFERVATAPRRFFELCSGAVPERLALPIAPGKWTSLQILRHLAGCDREALLPRIEKILAQTDPLLPIWDQDLWMKHHGDVRNVRAVQLLDEWARLREKIALTLFDLSLEQWARTGRHERRGSLTLFQLCCLNADHDDLHWRQISRHLTQDSALN